MGVVVSIEVAVEKRGRDGRGGRGNGHKRIRLSDDGNPPSGITWIEDKFYEPSYYAMFSAEQKSRLHELRSNRDGTAHDTQNVSSFATRLLQLEQLTGQAQNPTGATQIVQVPQQIAPVGVLNNANNPALQRLNQRPTFP